MAKKLNGFIKRAAIAGAAAAGAYYAVGSTFLYLSLTPKGTKRMNNGLPIDPQIAEIFATHPEVKQGNEWFENSEPAKLFTFNKFSDCLHAYFIPAEQESDVFVIECHGYTSKCEDMAFYGKRFHALGFNVLFPCLRGHDGSEHNYISMGWHDRLDVLDWIEYITEMNENAKIILHGASMGGATVMMVTGEQLPRNVVCAVEDCGYSSVWDEFSSQITKVLKLPVFPFLNAANSASRFWLGYDFKEASSLEQVKKSKTPTLFIHGDKDSFVPFEMLEPIYQAAACEKEKLVVPGALHAVSALVQPDLYWSTVNEFIKKYI